MSLAVESNEIGKIFSVLSLFGGFINSGIGKSFPVVKKVPWDSDWLIVTSSYV